MSFLKSPLVFSVLLSSCALVACSSSDSTLPTNVADGGGAISVFPDKVFVGVDDSGKAMAAAPVGLTGASGTVTWTSSNASTAKATGSAKTGNITAVAAGTATVTVKNGSETATVSVTVATYKAADVTAGQAEYSTAKCEGCHGADGPDITPSGVGKHDDAEVLAAAVDSKNPEGGDLENGTHKYTATHAIVAYLRSIPARTDTPIKDD